MKSDLIPETMSIQEEDLTELVKNTIGVPTGPGMDLEHAQEPTEANSKHAVIFFVDLIKSLIAHAKQQKIRLRQIKIINERYFPEKYNYDNFTKSYQAFQDKAVPTDKMYKDLYNVMICATVFERRRRLLYKTIFNDLLVPDTIDLLQNSIQGCFLDYLQDQHYSTL